MKIFLKEQDNLLKYPDTRNQKSSQITIGDLHGNSLTLMYFLLREGVIKLSEQNYQKLINIYTAHEFNYELIQDFQNIIESVEKTRSNLLIRLIGDEVCDRGQNDYFTLLILKKLQFLNQKIEIIFSNHGLAFINAFENYPQEGKLYSKHFAGSEYSRSLTNLNNLINQQIISKNEILELYNHTYKPLIKPISYTFESNNSLILYSHAPSDLRIIKNLALKFNIEFKDKNIQELMTTIDNINEKFHDYLLNNQIHQLFNPRNFCNPNNFNNNDTPIEDLAWNRCYDKLNFAALHNGYHLSYVYGHDKTEIPNPDNNIYGLDNNFGKSFNILDQKEIYKVLLIS